jgi:hypothetical protein
MVVEAVDRILWRVTKRTPLGDKPFILQEAALGCLPDPNALPIISVTALDNDTAQVLDHESGISRILREKRISSAGLEEERPFPILRSLLGMSTRVEWRPSQRRGR